ncbi:MAG TPA: peroxiredoxin [Balneolaceae bacterium]|nr:peroxiredoxin [Balneolaceae bacterium]|tara:strand:- start:98104 stop:98532 length:429 start_codon:yes stop_codon:yes gene_type:complete
MPNKKASAVWNGNLKEGNGTMSSGSGVLNEAAFTFASRFEDEGKSNPEELLGAAHAGCFSMAFSNELHKAGFDSKSVSTEATVTLEPVDGKPTVSTIKLVTVAEVPGIDEDKFQEIAEATKVACPISRALAVPNIELEATLK